MKITFRQGIVQHQQPTFLGVNTLFVDLIVTDTPCVIAFADGIKDYLYVEQTSVADAWGPITLGVDQWLYWEIDRRTAQRTFGITFLEPVAQATAPINPMNDQHWFDTSTMIMKVWSTAGNRWLEKIRTFACELSNGSLPISVSINAPAFDGTQVGNTTEVFAGQILFDATTDLPLKTTNNKFFTTEDRLTVKTIAASDIKVASLVLSAEAQQVLAPYTIVKFTDFSRVEHADEFTSQQAGQFGIIQESASVGDFVNVIVGGVITNPAWTWPAVNAHLYADDAGDLVDIAPIPNAVPVATVVDAKTIVLGSPQLRITEITNPATGVATEISQGTVRLNIPATVPSDPVAVGGNDPRLSDDRNPLPHIHVAEDVTVTPYGIITGANVQEALEQLSDAAGGNTFVELAGDTMTGFLTLNADPTDPLHAATKQYVDASGAVEPTNQIVFGTGTGIDSDADFTWDPTTHTLTIGTVAVPAIVRSPDGSLSAGANLTLVAGNGNGTDEDGGSLEFVAGNGTGGAGGGEVNIKTGDGGETGDAGTLSLSGGTGGATSGNGGDIGIVAGDALTNGNGGSVHIAAANAAGAGINGTVQFAVGGDTVSVRLDPDEGYIVLFSNNGSIFGFIGETYSVGDGGQGGNVDIAGGRAEGTNDVGGTALLQGGFSQQGDGGLAAVEGGTTDVAGGIAGAATLFGGLAQGGSGTQGSVTIELNNAPAAYTPGTIGLIPRDSYVYQMSGVFVTEGDARTGMYTLHTLTTDDTPDIEMFVDGTGGIRQVLLQDNSTWRFEIHLVARSADDESAAYEIKGCIDRGVGVASTAIVGSVSYNVTAEDVPSWDVVVDADTTTGALAIYVTGDLDAAVRWVAFVRTVEVTF
jgi:hypothetical protein